MDQDRRFDVSLPRRDIADQSGPYAMACVFGSLAGLAVAWIFASVAYLLSGSSDSGKYLCLMIAFSFLGVLLGAPAGAWVARLRLVAPPYRRRMLGHAILGFVGYLACGCLLQAAWPDPPKDEWGGFRRADSIPEFVLGAFSMLGLFLGMALGNRSALRREDDDKERIGADQPRVDPTEAVVDQNVSVGHRVGIGCLSGLVLAIAACFVPGAEPFRVLVGGTLAGGIAGLWLGLRAALPTHRIKFNIHFTIVFGAFLLLGTPIGTGAADGNAQGGLAMLLGGLFFSFLTGTQYALESDEFDNVTFFRSRRSRATPLSEHVTSRGGYSEPGK